LQASAELQVAQQQAAKEAAERARLEADLAGCRSWIRELEKTEQEYLKTIRWA
jgi:chaperonin cofactor prefoldin